MNVRSFLMMAGRKSEQALIRKTLEQVASDLFVEQIEVAAFDLLFMEWPMVEKISNTKKERTRQAIEQAAYDLFMEQGFTATSMRQIAEGAGLALGGIYNHYESKEEIFLDIIKERHPFRQILPLVLGAEGDTPEQFIRNAAQGMVESLGRDPAFLKLMFIEIVEFNSRHISLVVKEIAPQLLPVFEKLVRHHKSLRPIHPAVLLRSFLGMFFSYYVTGMFIPGSVLAKLMPKNSFDTFVDIYLHGILKETK